VKTHRTHTHTKTKEKEKYCDVREKVQSVAK